MTENQDLIATLTAAPATSIDDVLAIMQGIDATLPDADGLKWFNLLYLTVTRSVVAGATSHGFENSAWIGHLDVVFANLYFSAAAASVAVEAAPPGARSSRRVRRPESPRSSWRSRG